MSTFSTDDQEEQDDEEEQEEDDEDEEEISNQLVRIPSDYQTTDESEKQKDDDRVKDGEEDKERDVTNVNLKGGDVDMTDVDTTKDTEDAHVTLTTANPVLKQSNLFAKAISSIPGIVNEYLGSKMKEAVDVVIFFYNFVIWLSASKSNKLREEAQAENQEFLNSPDSNMQQIIKDQVKTQTSKIKSKVEKCSKNLYNALVEAYNTDKDLLSSYGDVLIIPTTRDDKHKDEEPSAGSNRGIRDEDQARKLSHLKNQLIESRQRQVLRKGPYISTYRLNETLTLHQNRVHLQIPRTTWSVVPIDYDKHAYWGTYHWGLKHQRFYGYATNMETSKDAYLRHMIIAVISLKIMKFFGYSHLEEITVRRQDDVLYKFREGDFKRLRRQDIKDMLLLLVQGKLTNLSLDDRYALNVALRMYTRRIVIQARVEDLQLAVESYQKKINLTRPDTTRPDLRKMTPYTGYPDVQGIIYQDELSRNRLMHTNELHKFSDDTLNHVRTTLNDIATEIQMDYFPKRRWSPQDKRRARVMISAIDRKLRDQRLMCSLEKFVGGRPYGGDLRLLERTI
ncbi:hypothetical protein Tco_0255872 [Tanacetum coccineum]